VGADLRLVGFRLKRRHSILSQAATSGQSAQMDSGGAFPLWYCCENASHCSAMLAHDAIIAPPYRG
jgi:hypothetical protein